MLVGRPEALDRVHRLFNGTRDGNECLRRGRHAIVDDDHDAGEIGLGKDRDWQLPCGIKSGRA